MASEHAIKNQLSRLLNIRKKLKAGDYLTLREEEDVSLILGIPKFKDRKEMETKIDELFVWIDEMLRRK